ncbi:UNVERIFIED_CONTAM: Adenylate kinase, chloroplastic [Sesamum radiatum]|uniref:adenylate kinase n=1 Tax=Sesamum radiatum TaxID=300843 RepID=A0AAW2M622_SESRA
MASCSCYSVNFTAPSFNPNKPLTSPPNQLLPISRFSSFQSKLPLFSLHLNQNLSPTNFRKSRVAPTFLVVASGEKAEPLRVMISGAPASGKGTQCELITKKYNLVHIAAGDLLRAEVAAGTENGKRAKEFMERGQLVPDEIVVMMVKERLSEQDSQEKGWLLDGYPRSVPEEILVERVVGRRLDPVTGKIYHLKYSPPETEEIAARLTQRFDDTEEKAYLILFSFPEKYLYLLICILSFELASEADLIVDIVFCFQVKLRLLTHNSNVEAVLSMYEDVIVKVDGTLPKQEVFSKIDNILTELLERKESALGSLAA